MPLCSEKMLSCQNLISRSGIAFPQHNAISGANNQSLKDFQKWYEMC